MECCRCLICGRAAALKQRCRKTLSRPTLRACAPARNVLCASGKAIAIRADATDAAAVKAVIEKTAATFGGLDVLVNNAGTAIPKPFEEATQEELDRVVDIILRGVFVTTPAALKRMNRGGRIINIGSCVGERMMTPGLVAYAATKGAIKMFMRGWPARWATGPSRSTPSSPARSTRTSIPAAGDWAAPQKAATALNRYGSVGEVAALVAFVAGPEAGYITGASLTVDGGTNA